MFGSIMLVVAEVLGCALVLYVIAGFIVSLRRLLPFLAIGAAVATIFAIKFINAQAETGNQLTYLFLPIVTSLFMMLCFQGDGYMDPRISENVYRLVSVERKWESVFSDEDTYVLHFSPVETGGFIENTLLQGILFFCLYYFLVVPYPTSWWGYIIPIYVIGMSVIDVLAALGLLLPDLICMIISIVMAILSVGAGIVGSIIGGRYRYVNLATTSMYEKCLQHADIDLDVSYRLEYEVEKKSGTTTNYFVYDAARDASAFYQNNTDGGIIVNSVIVAEPNFNGDIVWLRNSGGNSPVYVFDGFATETGGPFRYNSTAMEYAENYRFSEEIFYNFYNFVRDEDYLTVSYVTDKENPFRSGYYVMYRFNVDENRDPVSLNFMRYTAYYGNGMSRTLIYRPIYGETGLENVVNADKTVNGYTYDAAEVLNVLCDGNVVEYFFENGTGNFSDEAISEVVESEICAAIDSFDFAGGFDFEFQMLPEGDSVYSGMVYIHDAQSKTLFTTFYSQIETCLANYEYYLRQDPNFDEAPLYRLWPQSFAALAAEGSETHILVESHNEINNLYCTGTNTQYKYGMASVTEIIQSAFYDMTGVSNVRIDRENLEITFNAGVRGRYEYTLKYRITNGEYEIYEYYMKHQSSAVDGYDVLTLFTEEKYDLSSNQYIDKYRPQHTEGNEQAA